MSPPSRPDRHVFPTLPRRPIRVVLDAVTHLPNIGTIFRLRDAFRVERHGISPAVLELADQRIEIPTDGLGGSINLTSAAAIVLYEASRRFPLHTSSEPYG